MNKHQGRSAHGLPLSAAQAAVSRALFIEHTDLQAEVERIRGPNPSGANAQAVSSAPLYYGGFDGCNCAEGQVTREAFTVKTGGAGYDGKYGGEITRNTPFEHDY